MFTLTRRFFLCLLLALVSWLLSHDVANAQLVAYWNFDTDYKATFGSPTYSAIPTNGASISSVQSRFGGGSARFDSASSQYALTPNSPVPAGTYSYSQWFYLDVETTPASAQYSSVGTRGIAYEGLANDPFTLFFNIDGSTNAGNADDLLVSRVATGAGQASLVGGLPSPIAYKQWTNYIATVNYNAGTNQTTMEGFLNGTSIGTNTAAGQPQASDFLVFGADRGLNDRYWEGYIDDVAIYNNVLSSSDIAALQTAPPTYDPTPLSDRATLWQVPNQLHGSSYVIQSSSGGLTVIDGGSDGGGSGFQGGGGPPVDATNLKNLLLSLGGQVENWFISHPHSDHVSVLTSFLENPNLEQEGLTIGNIYGQLVSEPWLQQRNQTNMLIATQELKAALAASGRTLIEPTAGQEFEFDGLKFKILSEVDENGSISDPNDFSMVIRLTTPDTSVLFLGDLLVEGGRLLLEGEFGDELASDYVQVAHHGNNGVEREVYEAVGAKYALWPAQAWLYDALPGNPQGYDSWLIRQWMDELGVLENYVAKDGLIEIDLGLVVVPEPTTFPVMLLAAGLGLVRWRGKRNSPAPNRFSRLAK